MYVKYMITCEGVHVTMYMWMCECISTYVGNCVCVWIQCEFQSRQTLECFECLYVHVCVWCICVCFYFFLCQIRHPVEVKLQELEGHIGGYHTQPAALPCGVHCSLHSESSSSHICLTLVCLPQEAFQCILLACASKGVLSPGFTQSQYYKFHHGLAQALSSHCISLQRLAGGWSPSVFQGLVLSGTSWGLNPHTCVEGTNKQYSWCLNVLICKLEVKMPLGVLGNWTKYWGTRNDTKCWTAIHPIVWGL